MGLDNIIVNKNPVETDGDCQAFEEATDHEIYRFCNKLISGILTNHSVSFRGKAYANFIEIYCKADLYETEKWTKETYEQVCNGIKSYVEQNYFRRKWELMNIRNPLRKEVKANANKLSIDTLRLVNIELEKNFYFNLRELKALYDLFTYLSKNTDKYFILAWA